LYIAKELKENKMNEEVKLKLMSAVEKGAAAYREAFAKKPFDRKYVADNLHTAFSEVDEFFTMKEYLIIVYNYLLREQKMFFGFDDRDGALKIIPEELLL
jgi:hypothetical protein